MERDHDRVLKVVKFMEQHGGGFLNALAVCWYRADKTNQMILEKAFKHYFDEYQKALEGVEARRVG